jgi:hypothetical protein
MLPSIMWDPTVSHRLPLANTADEGQPFGGGSRKGLIGHGITVLAANGWQEEDVKGTRCKVSRKRCRGADFLFRV